MIPPDTINLIPADVVGTSRERAERWKRTLLPVLERLGSPLLSASECERIAVENSALHFSAAKCARHIRRIIKEVIRRDAGLKQFDRLHLYLEKNPPQIAKLAPAPDFADLMEATQGFTNPADPSTAEEANFLRKAWHSLQRLTLRGAPPKRAKAEMLEFLWQRMPWLSSSRRGLADKIARKFHHYEVGHGEAVQLLDGRAARGGERRREAFNADQTEHIIWHAARNCGGRVAQAMEDLLARADELALSGDFVEFLLTHRGTGSYVNRRLLDAVLPEVEMLAPYFLGKKALDDATAPLRRVYDKLPSMASVCADDFTMPVYCWLNDEAGQPILDARGRPVLTRGQVLLFQDVRSRKIIEWVLIPERNYTSLQIRTCMNRVCRQNGIPGVWYFENGIWKNSRAVKQTAPAHWSIARSVEETEFGWERLGVRFIHARRARSKPIEKIGDQMQRLMEGEPGYCGRDERRDCPEETKRAKLAVEAGRERPSVHFRSFDEWETRLGQIVQRYNSKAQGGRLQGATPDEAFETYWPHNDPPTPLDAGCWHLGAHLVRKFTVGNGGITFKIGKAHFSYFDENLSPFRNREVLAWFDPEQPESIAVTEPNDRLGKTACFVSRHNPVEFDATLRPDSPEAADYRRELKKQHGFNAYPKARYNSLKPKFQPTFRTVVVDRETAAMAEALQRGSDDKIAVMKEEDFAVRRIQDKARRLGQMPTELRDYSPETEAALDRRLKARRDAGKEIEEEP